MTRKAADPKTFLNSGLYLETKEIDARQSIQEDTSHRFLHNDFANISAAPVDPRSSLEHEVCSVFAFFEAVTSCCDAVYAIWDSMAA